MVIQTPDTDLVVFDLHYVRSLNYEKLLLINKFYQYWHGRQKNMKQVKTFSENQKVNKIGYWVSHIQELQHYQCFLKKS